MKKTKIIALVLFALCAFALCSCNGGNEKDIIGVWRTENVGYYTVTTFKEDGSFNSVYTVSDPEAVEAYGITQEMLDSLSGESFYTFVPESDLTPEEKELAKGRYAIKVFSTREEMEKALDGSLSITGGSMSFYTISGDTLTLDGCVFNRVEE